MSFYQDRYITLDGKSSKGLFYITNKTEQLLSKSVNTQTIPTSYGEKVKSVKHDSKTIKYSILFTMEQLQNAKIFTIHDLKRAIANYFDSDEVVKLKDSQDPNIYYNVLFQGTSEIQFLGNKTATTEVELLVPDGLGHSVAEKEFVPALNKSGVLEATIQNNGTADSTLSYEIKMKSENGYVGIVSENGVMEFGSRKEADGEIAQRAVLLTANKKGDFSNWTDATTFYENQTKKAVVQMQTDTSFGGRMGITKKGYTNTTNSAYFGAIKEFVIAEPATDWYLWAQAWFETGLMGQTGMWTLAVIDENNKEIASMHIYKTDTTGNTARIAFHAANGKGGGKSLKDFTFIPSYWVSQNPYGSESRDAGRNPFDIKKEGNKIRFYWYGSYFTYTVPEIANMKAKRIQFFVGQFKGRNATNQLTTHMYINNLSFTDTKQNYWKDIPNRYQNGDILRLDGPTKTPYVNGLKRFQDQIKGTEYFTVKNGETKIQFYYSDFATQPDIKIYLKEAFV